MNNGLLTLVPRTRLLNWQISLAILVTSIVLFIPLVQCLLLTYRWSSPKGSVENAYGETTDDKISDARNRNSLASRATLTAIPFIFYLVAFSQIPLPSHLDTSSKQSIYLYHSIVTNLGITMNAISRTTVLGTLLLGLLSGFGAVTTVWSFYPFGRSKYVAVHFVISDSPFSSRIVSESDVAAASAALERVRNDLVARQEDAERSGVPQVPSPDVIVPHNV